MKHIIDYGESHYVGPIKGAQPNSQAWVDGFPHEPWLQLNSYFSFAFKNGHYPKAHHDKIFIWGRPHPKAVNAGHDHVPRPDHWELVRFLTPDGHFSYLDDTFVHLCRPTIHFGLWYLPLRQALYHYHRGNTRSRGTSQLGYLNYLTHWNVGDL